VARSGSIPTQQDAVCFIILQNHCTCFGYPLYPSSGVLKTVTAASGTGHNIGTATSLHGQIRICPNATVCSLIYYTAKSLYMFRVSQHPSSGVLKTVTAVSGTGHNIGTATSLRGQIGIYPDATVCSLIYHTAKSLYMFQVSTVPIIRSNKNCNRSLWYRS